MKAIVKSTGDIIDVEYNDIICVKNSYITDEERNILELLTEAHNKFVALADKHPSAMQEWTFYIHGLQSQIEHRICSRVLEDIFR